ncbi:hypothetical protein GCM10027594_31020 [Hymenobacter agri]
MRIFVPVNQPKAAGPHPMKKTTAISVSSLLLLSGVSYLAAKLADLDLTFFFHGDDDHHHYC